MGFSHVGASYRTHVIQLGSFLIDSFILKLLQVYEGLTVTECISQMLSGAKLSQLEQLLPILIDIIKILFYLIYDHYALESI